MPGPACEHGMQNRDHAKVWQVVVHCMGSSAIHWAWQLRDISSPGFVCARKLVLLTVLRAHLLTQTLPQRARLPASSQPQVSLSLQDQVGG